MNWLQNKLKDHIYGIKLYLKTQTKHKMPKTGMDKQNWRRLKWILFKEIAQFISVYFNFIYNSHYYHGLFVM